jgi:hypothetical protein
MALFLSKKKLEITIDEVKKFLQSVKGQKRGNFEKVFIG